MGYDIHIARADEWWENRRDIDAGEWLEIVDADPELKSASENGPYFVYWVGESDSEEAWLIWSDGTILSKYPGEALLGKMVEIAECLDANVLGDDGELYDSARGPDETQQHTVGAVSYRPYWPIVVALLSAICFVVGLVLDTRFRPGGQLIDGAPAGIIWAILLFGLTAVFGWLYAGWLILCAFICRRDRMHAAVALCINLTTVLYLALHR